MKTAEKNITVLDIGSNTFHMIIAEVYGDGSFNIISRERKTFRLLEQKSEDIISEVKINDGLNILAFMKKRAMSFNASLFAVATQSLRKAANSDDFIKRAANRLGIFIRIISPEEEAEYTYKGVSVNSEIRNRKCIIFDIGGGSTEIIKSDSPGNIKTLSLETGTVSLSAMFFPDYITDIKTLRQASAFVLRMLQEKSSAFTGHKDELFIGSSGNMLNILSVIRSLHQSATSYTIFKKDIDGIFNLLETLETPEKRKNIPGIDPERADIFPASVIILSVLMKRFSAKNILVSGNSLREGILLSIIDNSFV